MEGGEPKANSDSTQGSRLTRVPPCATVCYMKTEHFSMRIDKPTLTALSKLAEEQERSVAWIVSKAIAEYLQKHSDLKRKS